jgi:molybdopterin molybdotransferase
MNAGVLTFEQAYDCVLEYCKKLCSSGQELVSISDALGRVLAQPVLADREFPPFPRATRDGYAVRCSDLKTIPTLLRVVGQVKAGDSYTRTVQQGEAVSIMTGAAVPEGADAVVMVEFTRRNGQQVEIQRSCIPGENIVLRGSEAAAGQEMLPRGTRLSFPEIAICAAVGQSNLPVHKKPRVAVLATGDELVEISSQPNPHQIRNSNTYSLAAQVTLAGGEPLRLPVAPDQKEALAELIREGLSADLLLLSGGVSMGEFDLVEAVLNELGARFFFTGAQIQPGKPIVFGEAPAAKGKPLTPFFGLPGNPVSTMVTFDLFVRPVVYALSGAVPVRLPSARARLAKQVTTKTGLTRFLPGDLRGGLFDPEVEIIAWRGSGDILAAARANCYVIIPPDRESIPAGEMISILLR